MIKGGSGYGLISGGGYGNSDSGDTGPDGRGIGDDWSAGIAGSGWGNGNSSMRWFLTSLADDFATQVYLTRVNLLVTTGTLR